MDLISCGYCGCVFDKKRIIEHDAYDPDSEEPTVDSRWNNEMRENCPVIDCPACSEVIFFASGDYVS